MFRCATGLYREVFFILSVFCWLLLCPEQGLPSLGELVAVLVQIQARLRLLANTPSVEASSLVSARTLPSLPFHFTLIPVESKIV